MNVSTYAQTLQNVVLYTYEKNTHRYEQFGIKDGDSKTGLEVAPGDCPRGDSCLSRSSIGRHPRLEDGVQEWRANSGSKESEEKVNGLGEHLGDRSRTIEQGRLYVQALRNFDLVLTETGTRVKWTERNTKNEQESRVFSDWVGLHMSIFLIYDTPDSNPEQTYGYAQDFVSEVDRGLTNGFIGQGRGLVSKWEKAEHDNIQLRAKLSKLIRYYRDCQEERRQLESQVTQSGQKPITVGNIQSEVEDLNLSEYDEYEDN